VPGWLCRSSRHEVGQIPIGNHVFLLVPTSWMMATTSVDEFTGRMFEAINGMLLDMLAAVARKDYDDRRRRQAQGQAKAKAEGKYKGRPADSGRNDSIASMLAAKQSWTTIQRATGSSARPSRRSPNGWPLHDSETAAENSFPEG
jgi:DNA invertase Pin-like site-specific DNA recombinase